MLSENHSDDIFRWSDGFNIGLSEIDDQHARLVAMLNRLARHHTSKTADEDLLRIFDELVSYTAYHFGTEDRVMDAEGVDARHAEVHRQAHRDFVTRALGARRDAETSPREVTGDTLVFLTNWLIHHILGMDRQLADEVRRAQKSRGAPTTTAEPPGSERTTEVLLHAVDGLYERLGRNTGELRETNARLQSELAKSKQAEQDLRIAAAAFEAQECIIITDAASRIQKVNKAFTATTGYTAREVMGRIRGCSVRAGRMQRSMRKCGNASTRRGHGKAKSGTGGRMVKPIHRGCPSPQFWATTGSPAISSAHRPTLRHASLPKTGSGILPITTS